VIYLAQVICFDLLRLPPEERYEATKVLEEALENLISNELPLNIAFTSYTLEYLAENRRRILNIIKTSPPDILEILSTIPPEFQFLPLYGLRKVISLNKAKIRQLCEISPEGLYISASSITPSLVSALKREEYSYLVVHENAANPSFKPFKIENTVGDSINAIGLNENLSLYIKLYLDDKILLNTMIDSSKELSGRAEDCSLLMYVLRETSWRGLSKILHVAKSLVENIGKLITLKDYLFIVPSSREKSIWAAENHADFPAELLLSTWNQVEFMETLLDLAERLGGSRTIVFKARSLVEEAVQILCNIDVYRDEVFVNQVNEILLKLDTAKRYLVSSLA